MRLCSSRHCMEGSGTAVPLKARNHDDVALEMIVGGVFDVV